MKNSRAHFTDLDSERALLGGLMAEEAIPESLRRKIIAEAFSEQNRLTARALISAFQKFGRCDLLTVSEELVRLGGGLHANDVLMRLAESAPVGADLDHLYGLVLERNGRASESPTRLSEGADEFLAGEIKSVEWAIEGIWPTKNSGPLAGPEKVGKGWIAGDLILSLTTGTPFLGKYKVSRSHRVLWWEEEDSRTRLHRRSHQLRAGRDRPWPSSENLRFLVGHGLKIDQAHGLKVLHAEIANFRPDFVVVGNLREVHTKDENRPEMGQVRDTFRNFSREFGCAFIVLHHFRKAQEGQSKRGSQMLAGSGVWGAWAEAWMWVTPGATEDVALLEVGSKDAAGVGKMVVQRRDVTDGKPLAVDENGQKVWPVVLAEVDTAGRADESRGKILDAVRAHYREASQPATVKILEAKTSLSRRTIVARLPELEAAGLVQAVNLHRNAKGYLPRGLNSGV
ncbi:MAG: AAA family ATPase [Candidatus Methylomirabilales bacterium]